MGIDAKMLVKTTYQITEKEVLRLAYELGEAFYPETFMIWKKEEDEIKPHHCLSIVSNYEQDADTIGPKAGEVLIEVHLYGRYYREGYERGNFPQIKSIAEWLEAQIPESTIFYGGDCGGLSEEPFDKDAREKLWQHFLKHGHRPYNDAFDH